MKNFETFGSGKLAGLGDDGEVADEVGRLLRWLSFPDFATDVLGDTVASVGNGRFTVLLWDNDSDTYKYTIRSRDFWHLGPIANSYCAFLL